MKSLTFFVPVILCSLTAVSQINKTEVLKPGVYKTVKSDGSQRAFFKLEGDSTFIYLGFSGIDRIGNSGYNYTSFQQGKWKIQENYFEAWGDKDRSKYNGPTHLNDSLIHIASNKLNEDSCYFTISVFDRDGKVKPGSLVYFGGLNKFVESNSSGEFIIQFIKSSQNSRISILQPTGYYPPTSISIDSTYNYHEIKIYLKKIPEKMGLILNKDFIPTQVGFKIKYNGDKVFFNSRTVIAKNVYFTTTPAIQNEFEEYLQEVIKVNPQFKNYLQDVRNKFYDR